MKVLKRLGLRTIQPNSFLLRTTDGRHGLGFSPNLLLDAPAPTQAEELRVGDITDLQLRGGAKARTKKSMGRANNFYDNAFMKSCWMPFEKEFEIAE